mmetsp:Transcript_12627/g.20904  ORF Transcript_12627/g.20904 Transcript_12627/m.20904 type:complete len:552 (+) Transcript_12627:88-1743(+)|eukprot:CAMPEP_0169108928 /NCGR_PEP_ID=MMETSP1015-20121227/25692_1 /TAXON_ID=342587 /ORGANISM="Karlodinium micrum, Strain CCMP2283" /LENGTH=551 /DNA_ID=CAMNT_0009170589 /DNA_START=88 /DNA_END=1743 /DNA_ORIENTATION=-
MAEALPEKIQQGLSASVKYLVTTFLQDKHYSMIGTSLASKWDKFQSLSAAMKLMEQHGVHLDQAEQDRLSSLNNEAQMIEALVMKMPQQSQEKFQHFFLQLQLIVSTATRVRQALELGRADLVEQAMDDADSTGVSQYILKMAIVQAGAEVTNLKKQHFHFVRDAEAKLSRLVHGQEDVIQARARLQKAQGELAMFQSQQNEAIKKVLMTFAGGSATALLHGCFSTWHVYVKKMKVENLIYEDYREDIEKAEQRLIDAKADQLKSVRSMIEKKHLAFAENLVQEVFNVWREDLEESKGNLATAEQVREMEARLKACMDHQAQSAKKVLARCGAASEQGLRDMCFHEWLNFHQEYLKNKEFEDRVKESERRVAEFMKSKSQGAQSVLTKMSEATDTGLIYTCFSSWAEFYKEEKRANEFAEQLSAAQGKFGAFGERNKSSAKNVMERAHEHQQTMLYLKVWGAWKLETRIEQILRKNQVRIDGKRQQLLGVQSMFRDFAVKLESNIAQSADSNRDLAQGPPSNYKKQYVRGMTRTEQTLSLPDIHSKPGSNH